MKQATITRVFLVCSALLLISAQCSETSECETTDFAEPALSLIVPENPPLRVYPDSVFYIQLNLRAEAGLNTLSVNGRPLNVYLDGETEDFFEYSEYFWYYGELDPDLEFVLHDLCNQSASLTVDVEIVKPMQ